MSLIPDHLADLISVVHCIFEVGHQVTCFKYSRTTLFFWLNECLLSPILLLITVIRNVEHPPVSNRSSPASYLWESQQLFMGVVS